jgi:hypothetical protein
MAGLLFRAAFHWTESPFMIALPFFSPSIRVVRSGAQPRLFPKGNWNYRLAMALSQANTE